MLSHDLKCELGRYSTTGEAPSDQEQAIDLCGQSVFRQLHHRGRWRRGGRLQPAELARSLAIATGWYVTAFTGLNARATFR